MQLTPTAFLLLFFCFQAVLSLIKYFNRMYFHVNMPSIKALSNHLRFGRKIHTHTHIMLTVSTALHVIPPCGTQSACTVSNHCLHYPQPVPPLTEEWRKPTTQNKSTHLLFVFCNVQVEDKGVEGGKKTHGLITETQRVVCPTLLSTPLSGARIWLWSKQPIPAQITTATDQSDTPA